MEIQSAFNSGVQGFQKATENANQAAADIAASTASGRQELSIGQDAQSIEQPTSAVASSNDSQKSLPSLSQSVVDLKVAEHQAKASAQVIKSADESLGTLLDVTA
jgi:predicted secreted protein